MVVAFDIDDTITRHPKFFSLLTKALVAAGHDVIIITYREDREPTNKALAEWDIAYTKLVTSRTNDLLSHGPDEWKAEICRQFSVEIIFEDMHEVIQHIDKSVVTFMLVDPEKHRLDLLAGADASRS